MPSFINRLDRGGLKSFFAADKALLNAFVLLLNCRSDSRLKALYDLGGNHA